MMNLPNLYNDQVDYRRWVLIHVGNYPKDSDGCLLIGTTRGIDEIGTSKPRLKELLLYLQKVDITKVRVIISNDF